ncbi:MAG TPA: apolipoprotein N-acyltransferase [Dermatophilaceae bacterium]|nr:apolipoprotein N-acyltransferase [Dermatophilaceae bacterium]
MSDAAEGSPRAGDTLFPGAGLRVGVRLALAAAGGGALFLAFPDANLPWCAPLGVLLVSVAVLGSRVGDAFLIGLVAGLACFVPTLSWSGIYVGALPWLALATAEAFYVAGMATLLTWLQAPFLRRKRPVLALALVPLCWVLQETARSSTPFGGFPWARLAFSQADSPLARFAALGGAPGVTLAVALMGTLGHAALVYAVRGRRLVAAVPVLGLMAVPILATAVQVPTDGERVPVAMVQGNVPRPGLDFNAERRKVLDNHVAGTLKVAASGASPSLVIWPENSSDIDPLRNADAGQEISAAVRAVGVPILVGAVLNEPAPRISNASLLYRPGADVPERYVKQHPVPFAEYMPYRSFFRVFSDKVDLLRTDFAPGHVPGSFRIPWAGGAYWALPTICFEVAYDDLVRTSVTLPGRQSSLLVVQTNNATFGYTAESEQQFAISRIRAIEHGRSVAHVSTVGVSALIAPDGSYTGKTSLFTPAQVLGAVTIRSGLTVSDRIGRLPEAVVGLLVLGLGVAGRLPRGGAKVRRTVTRNPVEKESLGV